MDDDQFVSSDDGDDVGDDVGDDAGDDVGDDDTAENTNSNDAAGDAADDVAADQGVTVNTDEVDFITLNVDREVLSRAPSFAQEDLGDDDNVAMDLDTNLTTFWANEVAALPQTGATGDLSTLVRIDNVDDHQLVNANGDDIGDVEDIILDSNGAAKWVIWAAGGFLDIGEQLVPVPFNQLSWEERGEGEQDAFVLNVSDDDADDNILQNVPTLDEIPDTSVEGWDADFDTFWSSVNLESLDDDLTGDDNGNDAGNDNANDNGDDDIDY
jgi:hypothetical protein